MLFYKYFKSCHWFFLLLYISGNTLHAVLGQREFCWWTYSITTSHVGEWIPFSFSWIYSHVIITLWGSLACGVCVSLFSSYFAPNFATIRPHFVPCLFNNISLCFNTFSIFFQFPISHSLPLHHTHKTWAVYFFWKIVLYYLPSRFEKHWYSSQWRKSLSLD